MVYLIDTKLQIKKIIIINNDDIIGITNDNYKYKGPYECFIYQKLKNNKYQKRSFIRYKSWVSSFLMIKNNKELIILNDNRIDIYEYKNLKLKNMIEHEYHINSYVNNKLFLINENIIAFLHINHTPTTFRYGFSQIIFYDINTKQKKSCSISYVRNYGKIDYFSSIKSFIQINFIGFETLDIYGVTNFVRIYNNSTVKTEITNFIKLNENEILAYNGKIINFKLV